MLTHRSEVLPESGSIPPSEYESVARIGSGGGLLYLGTLIQLVAQWVFAFIVARTLGAEALGLFVLGFVALQGLSLIAVNGLDVGLLRFVSPAVGSGEGATVRGMLRAALVAALIPAVLLSVVLSVLLPTYLEQTATLSDVSLAGRLFAPGLLLHVGLVVLVSFALAHERPVAKVLSEKVLGPLAQILVALVLVSAGVGLIGAVMAYVVGLATSVVVAVYFVVRMYPVGDRSIPLLSGMRELYAFSCRQGIATLVSYVLMNGVLFVLAHFASPGDVGVYTAASRFTLVGLLFLEAFGQMFAPLAARQTHHSSLQPDFERVTKWIVVLSAPLFVVMLAFPRLWMGIMGPEFKQGASVLVVLAIAQLMGVLTGPAGIVLAMRDRPGLNLLNNVLAWGSNLFLALLLVPRFGALGAAWAYLVGVIVMGVLQLLECRLLLHLVPVGKSFLKPLSVLVVVTIPFWGLALSLNWSLPAAVALSATFLGIYSAGMWFVGFQEVDIKVIRLMVNGMNRQILLPFLARRSQVKR